MIAIVESAFHHATAAALRLPFWLIALFSLAGYILLAFWLPLFPRYSVVPVADVRTFAPTLAAGLLYALLLCLLYALYGLAFRSVRRASQPPRLALLLGSTLMLGLPLLFTYPYNANDIFRYVIRGRVTALYGENPFTRPPDSFPDDELLPLAGEWAGETSPYGPLWELVAAAVSVMSAGRLDAGLLMFKGLGLLLHLAIAALLWLLLAQRAPPARMAYALLWAWNPALLLSFVVNGHNDALMLFWLVLGFWRMQRGQTLLGLLVMALGAVTKPIGLLALPPFFIAALRNAPQWRARLRLGLLSVAGSVGLAALAFAPFGSPLALGQRLLREAAAGGGFSPTALFMLAAREVGLDPPLEMVTVAAALMFSLFLLWTLWRTWHGRSPLRAAADGFATYMLQALKFRIWYAAWPSPWLLLDSATRPEQPHAAYRLRVGLWFLLTTQLSVVIYGHVRVYALGGSVFWAHLIGVPFTFLLPLLLASLSHTPGETAQQNPTVAF